MLKKLIASLSAFVVVAGSFGPLVTTAQSMYASDPEFVDALAWMYDNGLTMFNDVNSYRPAESVTREQAAKFVSQFRTNVLTCAVTSPACDGNFADMSSADASLQSSINQACSLGLMKGSNGMFMPKSKLTRAQLFTTIIRALEGNKDETVEPRWDNYFAAAASRGITSETDTYAQGRGVNRYEAALMLYRTRNACSTTSGGDDLTAILGALLGTGTASTGTVDTTPTNPVANGNLTVAVASDTPGVQYVPGTATNIRALKLDLTAGNTDANINSLNVKLAGLVDRIHIDGVYVTDGMYMPLTNIRTFGTDYKANLNFPGGMTIPAGTTKSVYVVVDTNASINERFVVSVDSPADVSSAGTVGGTFPLKSNEINTTQYVAPSITYTSQTNTLSSTCTNKYYIGDTNKQMGRFTLQSTNTNRAINMMAVRLRTTKNLAGIVSNLKLTLGDGTAVSTSYVLDGKYVVFFTNYALPYGTSRQFYIYGDVVGGDTNDMIQFYLDGSRDVVAFEADTNSPISVSRGTNYISQDYCVANGKTTISKSSTSPGNMNVPMNEQQIVGLIGNLFVKSEMNVDKIRVYARGQVMAGAFSPLCSTTTVVFPRSIDQVQLLVDGKIVDTDTSIDMTSCGVGGYGYLEFSLFNALSAGNHDFAIKFDTDSAAVLLDQVQFYVDPSSIAFGNNAEYTSNGTTVLTTDIAGSAQSSIFTINKSAIQSLARSDGYGNGRKIVAGTEKYKAFTYKVEANNIRPLVLNGLTVNLQNMNTSDNPFVTEVAITVDGSTGVVSVESVTCAAGVATCVVPFTSLGITIPQGGSRNVNFHVTTTNGYVGSAVAMPFDMLLTVPTSSLDVDDNMGNTASVPAALPAAVSSVNLDVSSASNVQISTTNNTVNKIVPANGNEYTVGTFTITSTDDSNTLKSLVLVNYPSSCMSTSPHVVTTNASLPVVNTCTLNAVTNGGVVNLYDSAGTLVASSTISTNGTVVFDPMSFALPYGVAKTLTVKVAFSSSTISNASETNKEVNLAMLHPGSMIVLPGGSTAQTLIESTTNGSVTATATYNNNALLKDHVVRKTMISVSSVLNPSAGTDSLVSLRGQTQATLFAANITADSANSANIYKVSFSVNAGGGYTISGAPAYTLRVDNNLLTAADVNCVAGSPVVCTFVAGGAYPNGYTISAGSTSKFELVQNGAPMSTSTAGQSLSTTINEAAGATVAANVAAAVTPATIVWSDNSSATTSLTENNWFSDYGVEVLPTTAWIFTDN